MEDEKTPDLGGLEFRTEDATGMVKTVRSGKDSPFEFETLVEFHPYITLAKANHLLAERLGKATLVWRDEGGGRHQGSNWNEWPQEMAVGMKATHTGRLVCIKPHP